MRRSIITTIVFVVGMTVYLLLLGHVVENQQAMQREECAQAAQIYADELEKDFNTSSSVTETLAYMIADTGTVPQHFADVAKEMMATRPYVASIQLAPQGRVTDIYPSDAAGAGKVNLYSLPDRLESLRYSRDTGIATMQGPFNLTDDYQAIALRQPIYLADAAGNRTFWGFAIAVLKVPDVFESTLTDLQETRHAYRISKTAPGRDDYHIVLASDNLPEQMEKKVFSYGGCQWKLEVAPADGWRIPLPLAVTLAVGLLLVFVLTFLTHVLVTLQNRRQYLRQLAFGLKDIILHFPGAILIYKATGKEEILFANLELIQLFDCTTLEEFQQHTGGTFRGIVHPDEYDAVEQSIWEQVKKPGSESNDAVRYRIRTKTGNIKNILDKGRLVDTDVYGQIFYVLLIDESNW